MLPFVLTATLCLTNSAPVICLDPGHPSEVGRGARGKKLTELDLVWTLARGLKARLEAGGYRVVLTKSRRDQMVRNVDRARVANQAKAQLLLRLHADAAPERGFATYYPDREGRAGQAKGPSPAVLRASRSAAKAFHAAVIRSLNGLLRDRGLRTDRQTRIGAQQGALTGSIHSQVPVLLVEVGVITQPQDEAILASPAGQRRLIRALEAGVRAAVPPIRHTAAHGPSDPTVKAL